MRKILIISLFLCMVFVPALFIEAAQSSAGFIPSNIWYSEDPFEEGDKIKVYTLIYNPDPRQLSGTVFFFDKTTFLGNKNFTVEGKGLKDISIDWTVSAGDHLIFAQIQNAKFLNSSGTYENANLQEIKTTESKRSVAKTIIETTTTKETGASLENATIDIPNFVKENTPTVVSSTIENTVTTLEDFRKNTGADIEEKKIAVKEELKVLESKNLTIDTKSKKDTEGLATNTEKNPTNKGIFLKPFKYTELFALSLFSTVFSNKYIFYGLIVIVIFFIFRFIVRRFF